MGAAEAEARKRLEECAGCSSPEQAAERAAEGWLRNTNAIQPALPFHVIHVNCHKALRQLWLERWRHHEIAN